MVLSSARPIHFRIRLLSMVRICSSMTLENRLNLPSRRWMDMWVGNLLACFLLVIQATTTVPLFWFALSFWITITGRVPVCSCPILAGLLNFVERVGGIDFTAFDGHGHVSLRWCMVVRGGGLSETDVPPLRALISRFV